MDASGLRKAEVSCSRKGREALPPTRTCEQAAKPPAENPLQRGCASTPPAVFAIRHAGEGTRLLRMTGRVGKGGGERRSSPSISSHARSRGLLNELRPPTNHHRPPLLPRQASTRPAGPPGTTTTHSPSMREADTPLATRETRQGPRSLKCGQAQPRALSTQIHTRARPVHLWKRAMLVSSRRFSATPASLAPPPLPTAPFCFFEATAAPPATLNAESCEWSSSSLSRISFLRRQHGGMPEGRGAVGGVGQRALRRPKRWGGDTAHRAKGMLRPQLTS